MPMWTCTSWNAHSKKFVFLTQTPPPLGARELGVFCRISGEFWMRLTQWDRDAFNGGWDTWCRHDGHHVSEAFRFLDANRDSVLFDDSPPSRFRFPPPNYEGRQLMTNLIPYNVGEEPGAVLSPGRGSDGRSSIPGLRPHDEAVDVTVGYSQQMSGTGRSDLVDLSVVDEESVPQAAGYGLDFLTAWLPSFNWLRSCLPEEQTNDLPGGRRFNGSSWWAPDGEDSQLAERFPESVKALLPADTCRVCVLEEKGVLKLRTTRAQLTTWRAAAKSFSASSVSLFLMMI